MKYYKYLDIDKIYNRKSNILEESKFWMSNYKYLNDPLEDFNCIVFKGDEINWKCFIRQYVFSYIVYLKTDNIDFVKVIYSLCDNKIINSQIKKDINKVLNDTYTIQLCKYLCDREVYIKEVKLWFRYLTSYWLTKISGVFSNDEMNLINEISIYDLSFINNVLHNKKHKTIDNKIIEVEWYDYYIDSKVDKKIKILSFYEDFFNEILNTMIPNYMIYSLSERYDSSLMWSHYANSHKGLCLEYEINEVSDFIEEKDKDQYYSRKVRYSDIVFPLNFFKDNVQLLIRAVRDNYHSLSKKIKTDFIKKYNDEKYEKELKATFNLKLSSKTLDWKNENEMRIVYSVADISDKTKGKLVKYKSSSLKSITFGTLTRKKDIVKVCKTCKELIDKGLKVYQCFYKYSKKSAGYVLKRSKIKKNLLMKLIN